MTPSSPLYVHVTPWVCRQNHGGVEPITTAPSRSLRIHTAAPGTPRSSAARRDPAFVPPPAASVSGPPPPAPCLHVAPPLCSHHARYGYALPPCSPLILTAVPHPWRESMSSPCCGASVRRGGREGSRRGSMPCAAPGSAPPPCIRTEGGVWKRREGEGNCGSMGAKVTWGRRGVGKAGEDGRGWLVGDARGGCLGRYRERMGGAAE